MYCYKLSQEGLVHACCVLRVATITCVTLEGLSSLSLLNVFMPTGPGVKLGRACHVALQLECFGASSNKRESFMCAEDSMLLVLHVLTLKVLSSLSLLMF
jgi:hypothetical protein